MDFERKDLLEALGREITLRRKLEKKYLQALGDLEDLLRKDGARKCELARLRHKYKDDGNSDDEDMGITKCLKQNV